MKEKIFITVFFIIICLPSLAMLFYKTDINVEKRKVQSFPDLKKEGKVNIDFFDELSNYFSDNFAFRQELIAIDAVIKSKIFKESNNEKVIVGKNGWLFFSETLNDYLGRNTLSDRQIFACARVLYLLQENAEQNGRKFVFTVAPNKNALFPEYMPDRYIKVSDVNNYSMLKSELSQQKVNFIDLHKLFQKDGKIVYHKLDTHWNNEGAAMACEWILDNIGKQHYDYSSEPRRTENNFSGDLYGMLFPKGNKKDDNVIYEKKHSYVYVSKTKNVEDISLKTENLEKDGSIVMYRDSFGNALIPFLADEFKNGYFTKAIPYNWELADIYNADSVVIEIAQRHIPSLIEGLPYMAAPIRKEKIDVQETNDCTSTLECVENEDGYMPFCGIVDKKYIDKDGKILIRFWNDKRQYFFEAFPATFEGENSSGYEYGMYLDTSFCEAGSYDVEVISEKEGKYYTSGSKVEITLEE